MFCTKCGAYNDDAANSCTVCNESFAEIKEWFDNEENTSNADSGTIVNPPKSYFLPSVILSVLGSIPFGIVAMVLSVMVDVNIESGNLEMAERYSKKTKLFCLISLSVGIVTYISVLFWVLIMRR